MKALATLLFALSLPGSKLAVPLRPPTDLSVAQHAGKSGVWYMAESGHAVFCYGPVMVVKGLDGGLQRVATFCRGDRAIVPLKD